MRLIVLILSTAALSAAAGPRKSGSPLDHLPANVEVLTHFGERADIAPDNQGIAFMAKSFGDAFVLDLKTRVIRCLTCNVPGAAFLRVMHFANGDYLLIGPGHFENVKTSRERDNELWYLSRKAGARPVKLGMKMSEGAAVSKKHMRLAFSQTSHQEPTLPESASRMMVADVDVSGSTPRLTNRKTVLDRPDRNCTLEVQDFIRDDKVLTFTCYEPAGKSSAWTLDLASGATVNQSKNIGGYNECEGAYPDGMHTLVESDKQARDNNWAGGYRNIDLWKLRLDGAGTSFERQTHFNDYEGWKASNPVVATDGSFVAFQAAKTTDEAGVGYGILIMRLK